MKPQNLIIEVNNSTREEVLKRLIELGCINNRKKEFRDHDDAHYVCVFNDHTLHPYYNGHPGFKWYTTYTAEKFLEHNQKQQNTMSTKTYTVSREFIGEIYSRVCNAYQNDINNYFNLGKNLFVQEFEVLDSKLQEWYNTFIGEIKNNRGDIKKLTEAKELLEKQFEFLTNPIEKERWIPEIKEIYYYIDVLGRIDHDLNNAGILDNKMFDTYNCFQTQEEAEKEAKRTTISRKYREWARRMNGDWKPDWNDSNKYGIQYEYKKLRVDSWVNRNFFVEGVCFPTKELAKKALKEFGDDLLLLVEYN